MCLGHLAAFLLEVVFERLLPGEKAETLRLDEHDTKDRAMTPTDDAHSGLRLVSGGPERETVAGEPPAGNAAQISDRQDGSRDAVMVLRDLVWRVDTVRYLAESENAPAKVKEVVALLDTSDVHAFLRGEP